MGSDEFDVIVVGGGIMGSCTAYELSKRGTTTTTILLLEQFDFLHYGGSSHGESRTLRLTYPEPYYPPLVQQASRLWEEAQSQIGYRVVYPTKHLDMGSFNDASLQASLATSRSNSINYRVLNHLQLSSEYNHMVSVPESWIGVITEGAAVIKPTKAVSMFQTLSLRNGVILKDNMKVTTITRDTQYGRIIVSTSTGHRFRCKKCVVTAGPWMQKLVREVTGRQIPVQPLETTIFYWKIKTGHEKEFSISGGFPSFAGYGDPYVYGTPSLEYPGLIKIAVHGGKPCDPDKRTWTWSSKPQLMEYLRNWIQDRFGGRVETDGPVLTQSCMYSMTPDEDFVIDYLGGEFGNDLIIAGGFSGHGFKMGPVIGRIVADMVEEDASSTRSQFGGGCFKLNRFENNPKGNLKEFAQQVGLHTSSPIPIPFLLSKA